MSHPESHVAAPSPERNSTPIASQLEKKLWQYAVVASAAGVTLMASPESAEGRVVYTPANAKISPSFALDLNHDGIIDFNLIQWGAATSSAGFDYLNVCHDQYVRFSHQCVSSTFDANASNLVRMAASGGAAALPFGAKIGPGQHFGGKGVPVLMASHEGREHSSNTVQYWRGAWANGGAGVKSRYLGLRFKINNEVHYGWARVTVTTTAIGFTATLTGYAYETVPNQAINAGQTSDAPTEDARNAGPLVGSKDSRPGSSLGLLALGADGLSLWRKEETVKQ